MSDQDAGLRLAECEARLSRHERVAALSEAIDARLEDALRNREPLERVMPEILEVLADHLGARGVLVHTLDESLAERTFVHGDAPITPELLARSSSGPSVGEVGGRHVVSTRIDVAGEDFGGAFAFFDEPPGELHGALLGAFCEELDNHLAAIAQSRRKYEIIRAISDALKDPVLERGIDRAIGILERQVGFADLVLMFRHEVELDRGALRYKVYKDGQPWVDSARPSDDPSHAYLRRHARGFLDGDDEELRAHLGITRYREEVLITGVRSARVVGRLLVTSRMGEFHTYDRELLDRFADYLRQRIVDFNREWRQLSITFPPEVCQRLLSEEGYVERWLTPRDREVAILFCDIAGFTRISEQVLKTPEAIGRLIDTWVDAAVAIIWRTGGAFDKTVGDCVIALWGPPFFEADSKERCAAALEAARLIRELTLSLVGRASLPELADLTEPIDVAIGLNFCPVSVGFFGPNDDYTAFSSGMNNAARLQGVATGGEILCMESFVAALGDDSSFSEPRHAVVKNVKDPLPYRALVAR
jgi:class 3 adenylate cyclase